MANLNLFDIFMWTVRRSENDIVNMYDTLSPMMQVTTNGEMLNFGHWDKDSTTPLSAQNHLCDIVAELSEFSNARNLVDVGSGLLGPAKKWNVDLKIHRAGDPSGQVAKAVSHCGKSVIIAGHSNTVPGLIKLFGIKDEVVIEDSQYGDLYMIRWENKSPVLSITFVGDKNSDE